MMEANDALRDAAPRDAAVRDSALRVTVFDYGAGNLHSLVKALGVEGATPRVTRDWSDAITADALVLPGVGSFGAAAAPDAR